MNGLIVRTYQPDDEPGMNKVIQASFKNPTSNAYPLPPARLVIIAELDGQIVGHTSIRPMLFHAGKAIVRGQILHMVGTDPSHQNEGIGHAMMDKVDEISHAERLPISLLETPVPEFYAQKGWEIIEPRIEVVVARETIEQAAALGGENVDIVDGSWERLGEYTKLREQFGSKYWLFVHTSEDYMKALISSALNGSIVDYFYEIKLDGQLAGYVLGSRDVSGKEGEALKIGVRELVLDNYDPGVVARVLAFLLDFNDEFQAVAAGHFITSGLQEAMLSIGGVKKDVGGGVDMAKIIMGKEWLDEIAEIIDGNLKQFLFREDHEPVQDILLDVAGERILLACATGHFTALPETDDSSAANEYAVSRNDFTRMAIGKVLPSTLVQEGKATFSADSILEQLDALFPPHPVLLNYLNDLYRTHIFEMEIKD
jgi:GNAT superfamily N-acetyltransferase